MKEFLKKTLTAGILALMACTSMSAIAEPQWVKVSEVNGYGSYEDYKGFDEICRHTVAYRAMIAGPWKVKYLGSWNVVSERTVYCNAINELDNQNFVAADFICLGSSVFSLDRPDGCYEYIDCDPGLYTRQAMPEACNPKPDHCPPKFPSNPDPCNGKKDQTRIEIGGVACEEGSFQPCFWPDDITEHYTADCHAQEIIAHCTVLHEKKHIEYGGVCVDGRQQTISADDYKSLGYKAFESEMIGNETSIKCYDANIDQCGDSETCRSGVEKARGISVDTIIHFRNRWEGWNNNTEHNRQPIPPHYYQYKK